MTQNNGRNQDKAISAGRRRGAFIAESIAIGFLLTLGTLLWLATPAHAESAYAGVGSPGPNFNMTVPPKVIPDPPVVHVTVVPPTVHHTAVRPHTTVRNLKPVVGSGFVPPTTVAPLPPCPTDGTQFAYGSCTVPENVADGHIAQPGAPSQISDPAGCGLEVVPAGYTLDGEDGIQCQRVPNSVLRHIITSR